MRRRLQQAALLVSVLLVFGGAAELVSRAVLPDRYYVWPPGFTHVSEFEPGRRPGISGPSRLTINSDGVRGDPMGSGQRYRILAIGGSTTITTLDDSEAWPYLVQQNVNAAIGRDSVWVGNVGRPGHTTAQHVLQVEILLEQFPQIDAVVLLVGINDLLMHLILRGTAFGEPPSRQDELRRAFSVVPAWDADVPWYRRSGIAHVLASAADGVPELIVNQPDLYRVERARAHRRKASRYLPEMPRDLPGGLAGFAGHLNRIIDSAEIAGVRVILLTQPSLWRYGLGPSELDQLWMGGPPLNQLRDGAEYYSAEALAAGMLRFNLTLLRVCRERGVECLHVAKDMPRNPTTFFDDAHVTEAGARRLAGLVSHYLLSMPPLAEPVP